MFMQSILLNAYMVYKKCHCPSWMNSTICFSDRAVPEVENLKYSSPPLKVVWNKRLTSYKISLSILHLDVTSTVEQTDDYCQDGSREGNDGDIIVFAVLLFI